MRKIITALIMFSGIYVLSGENLLKNPSFEKSKAVKCKEFNKYHRKERLASWQVSDWSGKAKDGCKRGKVGLSASSDAVTVNSADTSRQAERNAINY